MKRLTAHAFTLIELLVVLSIISLLVALLLPALRSARVTAQAAGSLSQVRQIAMTTHMYAADNRSSLPFYDYSKNGLPGETDLVTRRPWGWKLHELGYISTIDVLWSPARTPNKKINLGTLSIYTGYGANLGAMPHFKDSVLYNLLPLNLDKPKGPNPSRMILLAETWNAAWSTTNSDFDGVYAVSPVPWNNDNGPGGSSSPHSYKLYCYGSANVNAFVDSSARAVPANSIGYEAHIGGRSGWWIYPGSTSYRNAAPWYSQWYNY